MRLDNTRGHIAAALGNTAGTVATAGNLTNDRGLPSAGQTFAATAGGIFSNRAGQAKGAVDDTLAYAGIVG